MNNLKKMIIQSGDQMTVNKFLKKKDKNNKQKDLQQNYQQPLN